MINIENTVFNRLLGKNIREVRQSKNISQDELAEKAHVSTHYLSRVESGRQMPSAYIVYCIAGALNVSIQLLYSASSESQHILNIAAMLHSQPENVQRFVEHITQNTISEFGETPINKKHIIE